MPRAPATLPAFALHAVSQRRAGRPILDDATLEIPVSQVTVLLGPSGAGKSSLLRLLNRLDDPDGGTIAFDGRPLASYEVRGLRRRVGFVFQKPVVFSGTVRHNLLTAAEVTGTPYDGETEDAVLSLAGLDSRLATRDGAELSVGQQQRVNLARALIADPQVLLLDEPTSAVDPQTATHVLRTITQLAHERGITVVMATHRLEEARRVADHVVVLADGRVVEAGRADAVWASPQHDRTRRLLAASEEPI